MSFFGSKLLRWLRPSLFEPDSNRLLDEDALRFSKAQFLCFAGLALMPTTIGLNLVEEVYDLLPALLLTTGAICVMLATLYIFRRVSLVLVGTALSLMGLASYLILGGCSPSPGTLFWFILFPPVLLFCLGIRLGSWLSAGFLLWIVVIFVGPFQTNAALDLAGPTLARFLAALFGSFLFAWLAEYARHRTQRAFMEAAQMLERHALTDSLTSLGNRRDFQNHFKANQALALRAGRPFCIAMADIDHFKKVNDEHGHTVGDLVLCHVARVLEANLRLGDTVFRWGGEEFAILMAETDGENGRTCAERLRKAVEDTPYKGEKGLVVPLTISFGVYCGKSDLPMDDYVAEADHRLYLAKKGGRNRVEG